MSGKGALSPAETPAAPDSRDKKPHDTNEEKQGDQDRSEPGLHDSTVMGDIDYRPFKHFHESGIPLPSLDPDGPLPAEIRRSATKYNILPTRLSARVSDAMTRLTLPLLACAFVLAVLATGCTTGPQANATSVQTTGPAGTSAPASVTGNTTTLTAEGWTYPAFVAAPAGAGGHPGLVLLHSFNELEPGYRTIVNEISTAGFVVAAPEW